MLPFTPVTTTIGLSLASSPNVNGQNASLSLTFVTNYIIPAYGGCAIVLPHTNEMFVTLGVPA
jgi:hypothetical protein